MTSGLSIQQRIRKLGAAEYQGQAIVTPLIHLMGSQIEAIEPEEFLYNPTKLTKGLSELRKVLGLEVITCASSAAMEAEALGLDVDWSCYPPKICSAMNSAILEMDDPTDILLAGERIAAAIESTTRLSSTEGDDVGLCAALTSPAKLADELASYDLINQDEVHKNVLLDFSGRCVVSIVRKLCEARVNMLILQESDLFEFMIDLETWKAAFTPICNMARFHRVKMVLALDNISSENLSKIIEILPADVLLCLNASTRLSGEDSETQGLILEKNYNEWSELPEKIPFVTTEPEIAVDADIDELTLAIDKLTRNIEA